MKMWFGIANSRFNFKSSSRVGGVSRFGISLKLGIRLDFRSSDSILRLMLIMVLIFGR
jgi:hypothetical protein